MTTRVSWYTEPGEPWQHKDFKSYKKADKFADKLLSKYPDGCAIVDLNEMLEAMQKNGDLQ